MLSLLIVLSYNIADAKSRDYWKEKSLDVLKEHCQTDEIGNYDALVNYETDFTYDTYLINQIYYYEENVLEPYNYYFNNFYFYTDYYRMFILNNPVEEILAQTLSCYTHNYVEDPNYIFNSMHFRNLLYTEIENWLGTPYRWAGRSKRGVDCSNFVSKVLENSLDINIPAGARYQVHYTNRVKKIDELQFGDLLFFSGSRWGHARIGHVGIYIGNGVFAHASSYHKRGVIFSHISESYYKARFRFGGRIKPKLMA